jgi:RHS repeat-associated protein
VGAATPVESRYVYLKGHLLAEAGGNFVHTDGLGSPVGRTNAAKTVVSRTRYEPYGLTATGTVPTTIGFTGHVNDADTGLVYMQQRYYDPVAARFMSTDPVLTDAETGGSFNRYTYANNSPYKYVDPDGRDPEMPSFFTLSTMEGLKRDTSLDQAVGRGALTRDVTLPTIAAVATPSAIGIAGIASDVPMVIGGEAIAANGSLKNGRIILKFVEFLGKVERTEAPKPPSLPSRSPPAIEKIVKQIKADSKVPQPKKDPVPPPPPPPPKIKVGE